MKTHACLVGLLIAMASSTFAQQQPAAPQISTSSLERCITNQICTRVLQAGGGTFPLHWRISQGALPPGLTLQSPGTISGTPATAGTFSFTVEVADSSRPPQKTTRQLSLRVLSTISIDWKQPPALQETAISGSLLVANNTADTVDLTVIVVAVNEYGKAFTLGYQHFPLAANATSPEIPFQIQKQMPRGRYNVRADAVAEIASKKQILRTNKEAGPFDVP